MAFVRIEFFHSDGGGLALACRIGYHQDGYCTALKTKELQHEKTWFIFGQYAKMRLFMYYPNNISLKMIIVKH